MINKKFILPLFALLAIIQLMLPLKIIYDKETTISEGKAFKFKTRPVDPNDPFRGKYIVLTYKIENYKTREEIDFEISQEVYVSIEEDKINGYAKIIAVSKDIPEKHDYYFKSKIKYIRKYKGVNKIRFKFPFNRFYMEETKALQAEKLYNRNSIKKRNKTYAIIKINEGDAVLQDVYIGKYTIKEILHKNNQLKD